MNRILLALALLLCPVGVSAQVVNANRIIYKVDARTIASNGTGAAAVLTLTPTGSYVAITCNDPDTCAITMGESSIPDGMPVTIVNMSANAITFADTAGVSELTGAASLGQYATLTLIYRTDRWVEESRSSGSGAGTVTTTGSPASGNLAFFSGASSLTNGNLSGDATTSGTGAVTLTNNAVLNTKLRDSGALSVIGRSANSTGDPADISASAASDAVLRESGSVLGFGTIATAGLANNAVTYAKIQDVTAGSILIGRGSSGSGDPQEISLGGGLTMSGTTLSSTVVGTGGGDVVGPAGATDEAVARFDTTTGKLLQNTSTLTLSDAGAFTFADGVKQTFNPNGTNAGINVGSQAGNPSALADGDIWYNSSGNALNARINGATVSLGAGGTGAPLAYISYNPGSAADVTTTSATPADIDATNLSITFTAPASGSVAVELSAVNLQSSGATGCGWNLRTTGGSDISGTWMQINASGAQQTRPFYRVVITGLTPSASITYRWGQYVTATAATCNTRYGGGDAATARGSATMTVWALP